MLERREKMLVNILIVMGIIIGGLIVLDFLERPAENGASFILSDL